MVAPLACGTAPGDHAVRDASEASLRRPTGLCVVHFRRLVYAMDHPDRQ